jgi:hypothetical protein
MEACIEDAAQGEAVAVKIEGKKKRDDRVGFLFFFLLNGSGKGKVRLKCFFLGQSKKKGRKIQPPAPFFFLITAVSS